MKPLAPEKKRAFINDSELRAVLVTPAIVVAGGYALSLVAWLVAQATRGTLSSALSLEAVQPLYAFPVAFFFSYVYLFLLNLILGLPAYLILRSLGAANLYTSTAFGAAIGFAGDYLSTSLTHGAPPEQPVAMLMFVGGINGLIFWILANRPRSQITTVQLESIEPSRPD